MTVTQTSESIGVGQDVGSTSNGHVDLVGPERGTSTLYRRQTGRARSIDVVTGTGELEEVVDSSGSESSASTGDEVGADFLGGVDLTVIVTGLTVEGTGSVQVSGSSSVANVTSTLEGFVSCDETKTLHRISLSSFTRGHVEERRVE